MKFELIAAGKQTVEFLCAIVQKYLKHALYQIRVNFLEKSL